MYQNVDGEMQPCVFLGNGIFLVNDYKTSETIYKINIWFHIVGEKYAPYNNRN